MMTLEVRSWAHRNRIQLQKMMEWILVLIQFQLERRHHLTLTNYGDFGKLTSFKIWICSDLDFSSLSKKTAKPKEGSKGESSDGTHQGKCECFDSSFDFLTTFMRKIRLLDHLKLKPCAISAKQQNNLRR